MRFHRSVPLLFALVLGVTACDETPPGQDPASPVEVPDPARLIVDSGDPGAPVQDFHWLSPVEELDIDLSEEALLDVDPVVRVCELVSGACGAEIESFSGDDVEVVTEDGGDGFTPPSYFQVQWRRPGLDAGEEVRVEVVVGTRVVGLADFRGVRNGRDRRQAEADDFVPVQARGSNRTLPLKFWIGPRALCADAAAACGSVQIEDGGQVTATDPGTGETVAVLQIDDDGGTEGVITVTTVDNTAPGDGDCTQNVDFAYLDEDDICVEIETDLTQVGDPTSFSGVLAFCPSDALRAKYEAIEALLGFSIDDDVPGAESTLTQYPDATPPASFPGCPPLQQVSLFEGTRFEGLGRLATRLAAPIARLLEPAPLGASDLGFGMGLDQLPGTIYFWGVAKEGQLLTTPATEAPTGQSVGDVDVQVTSTHPTSGPGANPVLPNEPVNYLFRSPGNPAGDLVVELTDAAGVASLPWIMGAAAGVNTLEISGIDGGLISLDAVGLGVVSRWTGDGTTEDAVGVNDGPAGAPGGFTADAPEGGSGFSFGSGADELIFPASEVNSTDELTVATWVRLDASGPADQIQRFVTVAPERAVLRQNSAPAGDTRQLHFFMQIDDDGDGFDVDGSDLQAITVANALLTGCWQHVAGTYDGATLRLYLDGAEVGSLAVAGAVVPGTSVNLSSAGEPLEGDLDDVRYYNEALSAADVAALAAGGVTLGCPAFADGFESSPLAWGASGFWNRSSLSGIQNAASPTYVQIPAGDPGTLPDPASGSWAAWYGDPATGNYLGTQVAGDGAGSGGTSVSSNSGEFVSPPFTMPASNPLLTFQTWWSIESVNPASFDLMEILVRDASGVDTSLGVLNPASDPAGGGPAVPLTSGGLNAPPAWVSESVSLAGLGLEGTTVRIVFRFGTGDELYNGFRGWAVDDVSVDQAPALAAVAEGASASSAGGLNPRPDPKRRE